MHANHLRRLTLALLAALLLMAVATVPDSGAPLAGANPAPTLGWIQWTDPGAYPSTSAKPAPNAAQNYSFAPTTSGQLQLPNGSTVYVALTGEIIDPGAPDPFNSPSAFGTNGSTYWSTLGGTNGADFLSANVPSLPTSSDRIAVAGNAASAGVAQQTLSFFSDANFTTPTQVTNIVMLFRSLGQSSVTGAWEFDTDFDILSGGIPGGAGQAVASKTSLAGGARLSGREARGTIQFTGNFSSLSWTVTQPEFFAVWNIGVTSAEPPSSTPVAAPLPPDLAPLVTSPTPGAEPTQTTTPSETTVPPATSVPPTTLVPAPVDDPATGVLPETAPGVGVATENDVTVPVETFFENGTDFVMRGQDFELRLAGGCTVGCTIATTATGREVMTLQEGGVANTGGYGFMPGTPVYLWLFSEPRFLGELTVAADGTFTGQVSLAGVPVGEHTLQVNGTSFDGQARSANLGVLVNPAQAPVPTDTGTLPATGTGDLLIWVLLLLASGTLLTALGRRTARP